MIPPVGMFEPPPIVSVGVSNGLVVLLGHVRGVAQSVIVAVVKIVVVPIRSRELQVPGSVRMVYVGGTSMTVGVR